MTEQEFIESSRTDLEKFKFALNSYGEVAIRVLLTGTDMSFTDISDTPASYTGQGGKVLKVTAGEDGIEFNTLDSDEITEGGSNLFLTTDERSKIADSFQKSTDTSDNITEGGSNLFLTTDERSKIADSFQKSTDTSDNITEGSTNLFISQSELNRIDGALINIASTDLDTITTSGDYYAQSTCTNLPVSSTKTKIEVRIDPSDSNNIMQSAVVTSDLSIYLRKSTDGGSTWGSWTKPSFTRYKKATVAMSGTSLVVSDSDVETDTGIVWTASSTPNGFIQVDTNSGSFTITSTASETCSFTYYLLK